MKERECRDIANRREEAKRTPRWGERRADIEAWKGESRRRERERERGTMEEEEGETEKGEVYSGRNGGE